MYCDPHLIGLILIRNILVMYSLPMVSGEGYPWSPGYGAVSQVCYPGYDMVSQVRYPGYGAVFQMGHPRYVHHHRSPPFYHHNDGYMCGDCSSCRVWKSSQTTQTTPVKPTITPEQRIELCKKLLEIDDDIKRTFDGIVDSEKAIYRRKKLESDAREIFGVKELPKSVMDHINELLSMSPS